MNMKIDFNNQKNTKLQLTEKNKSIFVEIEAITYLQCDGYITSIHLINEETVVVSKLLKHFEKELSVVDFKRVNHSTLVNLKHVTSIHTENGQKLINIKDATIKVSRRKSFLFNLNKN
ncbi:MAG: LytTR family transcriptional regulator DNA-binding domain-containing protein [Bacteroidota bacterium]